MMMAARLFSAAFRIGFFMGEREIRAENGETVLFLEDFGKEDKQTLMAENHAIPFLAAKGNVYAAYSLKLTGLPVVTFTSTEEMTEAGEMLYAFSLYDSNTKTDWVTTCYTTSRLRGNTSLAYEKKSLRLMLKKKKRMAALRKRTVTFWASGMMMTGF